MNSRKTEILLLQSKRTNLPHSLVCHNINRCKQQQLHFHIRFACEHLAKKSTESDHTALKRTLLRMPGKQV